MKKTKPGAERYELRPGFRLPAVVDAMTVGRQIEALKKANSGGATPKQVVEAARPKGSPLHPCFEWREGVAAERWREEQARHLIRCYVILHPPAPGSTEPVRCIANVSVRNPEGERSYCSSARVLTEVDLHQQVAAELERMLRGVVSRYRHLPGLRNVVMAAVERVVADLDRKEVA